MKCRAVRCTSSSILFVYFVYFVSLLHVSVSSDTKLLVISLDGFRYDYYDTYSHLMPNLRFLATHGIHAVNGMKSTMATMTFPAHYTIATGLNEESHGLVANAFYDRSSNELFIKNSVDNKFYGGEPIWVTAKKHHHKTAVVIWIGNTADWSPYQPDYNLPFTNTVTYEERIERALNLLNSDTNFTMVYIDDPDSTQHAYGTFSTELQTTLVRLDRLLSPAVSNATRGPLANKLNVLIVSDHGMLNVTNFQQINVTHALLKAYNVTRTNAQVFSKKHEEQLFHNNYIWTDNGVVTHFYITSNAFNRTLQANLLRRLITSNDTKVIYNAIYNTVFNVTTPVDNVIQWNNLTLYLKSQLPERWHYRKHERIGDLVIVGQPGAMVYVVPSNISLWQHAANHGYDNDLKEMRALFVGYGPHFKNGHKLKHVFPQNCVYSLMCDILSATPAPNNGTLEPFRGALAKKMNAPSSTMSTTLSLGPLLLLFIHTLAT